MQYFEAVDVALSRWSIFIQIMINIPLFILFLTAWYATKRKIIFTWTIAWAINIFALAVVFFVAYKFVNTDNPVIIYFYALYGSLKCIFAFILLFSVFQFTKKDGVLPFKKRYFLFLFLMIFLAFLMLKPVIIQFLVYLFVAFSLIFGGIYVFRKDSKILFKIVSAGFLIDGAMFLHHAIVLFPVFYGERAPNYMSRVSFFDAITEFVLALSFLLAVIIQVIGELSASNRELERNQETLRSIVDVDPLTGLKNRRVLRSFVEGIKGKKGAVAFIDVNRFKSINDNWGHSIGDKCLVQLAESMRETFRAEDGLFRIGGDEFLVVCPGLDETSLKERIKKLRKKIFYAVPGVKLTIAVGIEEFDESLPFEEILKKADKKMYFDKKNAVS